MSASAARVAIAEQGSCFCHLGIQEPAKHPKREAGKRRTDTANRHKNTHPRTHTRTHTHTNTHKHAHTDTNRGKRPHTQHPKTPPHKHTHTDTHTHTQTHTPKHTTRTQTQAHTQTRTRPTQNHTSTHRHTRTHKHTQNPTTHPDKHAQTHTHTDTPTTHTPSQTNAHQNQNPELENALLGRLVITKIKRDMQFHIRASNTRDNHAETEMSLLPSKHAKPTGPTYTSKCAQEQVRGEVNAAAMRLLHWSLIYS